MSKTKQSIKDKKKKNTRGEVRLSRQFRVNPINNRPIQTRSFRFRANNMTSFSFTDAQLTGLLGSVRSGSTAYYPIFECVKILQVTLTLLPDTIQYMDLNFNWTNPFGPTTLETMIGQVGTPIREPFYPPEGTPLKFFYGFPTSSTQLFGMTSASGADVIMDINVQYIIQDGVASAITITNPGFDGIACRVLPASPNNFVAVGITSVS